MDADEQDILNYLKAWPKQYIAAREICRRAGGKRRFREDPFWANQPLLRLVEKNFLENDAAGYYRLKPDEKQAQQKRWVSPQIKQMLEESGKGFDGAFEVDEAESDNKPGP